MIMFIDKNILHYIMRSYKNTDMYIDTMVQNDFITYAMLDKEYAVPDSNMQQAMCFQFYPYSLKHAGFCKNVIRAMVLQQTNEEQIIKAWVKSVRKTYEYVPDKQKI